MREAVHRVYLFYFFGWILLLLCCSLYVAGDPWRAFGGPYSPFTKALPESAAWQVTLYLSAFASLGVAFIRFKGVYDGETLMVRTSFSKWSIDRQRIVGFDYADLPRLWLDSGQRVSAGILGEARFLEKMRDSTEPLDLKSLGKPDKRPVGGARLSRSSRGVWVYALPWLFGVVVALLNR